MIIRKLQKDDINSLYELLKESFSEITVNIESLEKLTTSNNVISIVAYSQQVIGNITITLKHDYIQNKKIFYLDYVCVKKDYRNRKVATYLLKEVEKLALKNNVSEITFTSSPNRLEAQRLYLNNNYSIRNTNVFYKKIKLY